MFVHRDYQSLQPSSELQKSWAGVLSDYGLAYENCPDVAHMEWRRYPKMLWWYTGVHQHRCMPRCGLIVMWFGNAWLLHDPVACVILILLERITWRTLTTLDISNLDIETRLQPWGRNALLRKTSQVKKAQYMKAVELLGYNGDLNVLQGLKAIGNKDEGKLDFSAMETEVWR